MEEECGGARVGMKKSAPSKGGNEYRSLKYGALY